MQARRLLFPVILVATCSIPSFAIAQSQDYKTDSDQDVTETRNNTSQTELNVTQAESPTARTEGGNDVIDVLTNDRQFTMFIKAFRIAGTSQILQDSGPFTIFAPTNDAFGAMPEDKLEMLLKKENKEELVQFLNHHVVTEVLTAEELSKKKSLNSVEGTKINISTKNGEVMINGGNVSPKDVKATNGIIHGIDKVLMPDMDKP